MAGGGGGGGGDEDEGARAKTSPGSVVRVEPRRSAEWLDFRPRGEKELMRGG